MKKTFLYLIKCLLFCLFYVNCSSGGDNTGGPDPLEPPGVASLIFPSNNSECTEGSNVSTTESTITFDWYNVDNASSYEIFIKNLMTQTTENYTTSTSEKSVTILKGTPYSWYVVSKNATNQTAQSSTWKFYNAGEAVSSYAPFPADLVSPNLYTIFNASTTNVSIEWTGEDVDNDIKEFDVYFDTVSPPSNKITTTSSSSFSVAVVTGKTYYWRIITKDNQGNKSESQIFQFSVQ